MGQLQSLILMVLLSPISEFVKKKGYLLFTNDLFFKFLLNRKPANYHAALIYLRKVVNQQLHLNYPPSIVHSINLLKLGLGGRNQTRLFLYFLTLRVLNLECSLLANVFNF